MISAHTRVVIVQVHVVRNGLLEAVAHGQSIFLRIRKKTPKRKGNVVRHAENRLRYSDEQMFGTPRFQGVEIYK
jgi:hypothetical protein